MAHIYGTIFLLFQLFLPKQECPSSLSCARHNHSLFSNCHADEVGAQAMLSDVNFDIPAQKQENRGQLIELVLAQIALLVEEKKRLCS